MKLYLIISICLLLSIIYLDKANAELNKTEKLKGDIHLIKGIKNYRLEVKFSPKSTPYFDRDSNLKFYNTIISSKYSKLFDSLNLKFVSAINITLNQEKYSQSTLLFKDNISSIKSNFIGLMYYKNTKYTNEELLEIANYLETLPIVEYADLVPDIIIPPPFFRNDNEINKISDDFTGFQNYKRSNPGIDANYANSLGMFGQDIRVADIEYDWDELHEDFPESFRDTMLPTFEYYQDHGSAVLGILTGVNNNFGITGTAYNALYRGYGENPTGRALAILNAAEWLRKGDIMLLEMQTYGSVAQYGPADLDKSVWDAVQTATNKGIIVIAAAGNGSLNLNTEKDYMNRGDNRSIIVGAGSCNQKHEILYFSSYGSRVNLQGWGDSVFTIGYGNYTTFDSDPHRKYTHVFSGTSSATPIVSSAAILVQCYSKNVLKRALTPIEMRRLLMITGIEQGGNYTNKHIGPLPNTKAAIELLNKHLSLKNNDTLFVDYNKIKNLSSNNLFANTFLEDSLIIYKIINNPKKGKIVNSDSLDRIAVIFSQQDIINGKILYQHTDVNSKYDDFEFIVTDNVAESTHQIFDIYIHDINNIKNDLIINNNHVKIYPNPSNNNIYLESKNIIDEIILMNIKGEIILQNKPESENYIISIDMLNSSEYFIKIRIKNEYIIEKIIINK